MSTRNLRHKTVPVYDDDDEVQDEIDGKRSYDVQEKLVSSKYNEKFILDLKGTDLTFERIQKFGLNEPIRIKTKDGLGVVVPEDPNFGVSNVRACVGSRRMIDVMDCKTQKALIMSMRDFERYFKGSDRKHIYNVISLEFSQSKLESFVKRPVVVDNLDWIDLVWPQHLKNIQTDQTNTLHNMKYPKVQKYCLMSVAGCYTDFHIDFGGTSVWYHILKGGKVFWLIPPTKKNLTLYERWTRSGNQGDVFFADIVEKCERVELEAGNSLMIPSGWIHAVYTPKDSLVFGGNFLNSFNIPMQLEISNLEMRLKVPNRFRFPFFSEVLWYALERYIHTLTGKSFLNDEYKEKNFIIDELSKNAAGNGIAEHVHITPFEYNGIQKLIESLSTIFQNDNHCAPEGIIFPKKLIEAGKDLLRLHADDDKNLAITGKAKAFWPTTVQRHCMPNKLVKRSLSESAAKLNCDCRRPLADRPVKTVTKSQGSRSRRVRCKQCVACLREDCKECVFCLDMRKFGGPGTMKQSCVKRKCMNPILPKKARLTENTPQNGTMTSDTNDDNHTPTKKSKLLSRSSSNESFDISISRNSPLPSIVIPRVSPEDLAKFSAKTEVIYESNQHQSNLSHYKTAWLQIFKHLNPVDRDNCRQVCSEFSGWLKLTDCVGLRTE